LSAYAYQRSVSLLLADLQRDALTRAGCTRIYEDRISGAKAARPDLALALEVARGGDQLVVWRRDRLGRSMSDLIALTRTFQKRGVELRSLSEGIDTGTIQAGLGPGIGRLQGRLISVPKSAQFSDAGAAKVIALALRRLYGSERRDSRYREIAAAACSF
jgi:Resolvase, N terminal domain